MWVKMRLNQSREIEIKGKLMIYLCPKCGNGFTLPVGDYMREKNKICPCNSRADCFIIGEIDGLKHRDSIGRTMGICHNIYEVIN